MKKIVIVVIFTIVANVLVAQQPADTLTHWSDTTLIRQDMVLISKRIESLKQDSIRLTNRISMIEAMANYYKVTNDSISQNILSLNQLSKEKDNAIDSLNSALSTIAETSQRIKSNNQYLRQLRDSLIIQNNNIQTELQEKNELLNNTIIALKEKETLFLEKEELYKEAIANSNVDKVKLQGEINVKETSISAKSIEIEYLQKSVNEKEYILAAQQENYDKLSLEKERYFHLADSLRNRLVEAEKVILQKNEQLKYTEQRAKDAESKINAATSRKKKVSAIQGLAMRTFRTPDWDLSPAIDQGTTVYKIINRNAGSIEFDYITGASVMLWDLTKNKKTETLKEVTRFDQDFSYSLGLYVGFGGSNLFKNFYVGPTFKFLDFFHFSAGVNICEYEILNDNVSEGDILQTGWSISDQTRKAWMAKPFFSLSFDLDFISYIKR